MPYKGLDLLLEAWAAVEARSPGATLVVAGTGSPELLTEVRNQVNRLGLRHVRLEMRFITTEDLVALYRSAAMVVYPYRAITTSGALATGIALGKAVVASDLPVFRELLTDGADALLVPPGDIPALASAILRLLEDSTLRQSLEANMRSKNLGEASWDKIALETVTVYEDAISAPPRRRMRDDRHLY